jgi:hypothetical protein
MTEGEIVYELLGHDLAVWAAEVGHQDDLGCAWVDQHENPHLTKNILHTILERVLDRGQSRDNPLYPA